EAAFLVDLPDRVERIGEAVGAGEPAEETIERPILLIDDDDVVDQLDRPLGARVASPARAADPRLSAEAPGRGRPQASGQDASGDGGHRDGLRQLDFSAAWRAAGTTQPGPTEQAAGRLGVGNHDGRGGLAAQLLDLLDRLLDGALHSVRELLDRLVQ